MVWLTNSFLFLLIWFLLIWFINTFLFLVIILDYNYFFIFILEPNAAPSAVAGYNTSSTSIFVDWDDVPQPDQNGIILSYTVTYTELPNGSPVPQVVDAPTTQATLTGLNEYTNYSITVLASTSKGNGNVSEAIIVITDQDSK